MTKENQPLAGTNMESCTLHTDDANSPRIRNSPFMLRLFVAVPAQRLQVIQHKSKLRKLFQRLYVVHFCCWSELLFSQALLAKIMVALKRQESYFSPLFSLVEASFFESAFSLTIFVHRASLAR